MIFGLNITHGLGLTHGVSQVSGFERTAKHNTELAKGFSYGISAGPNVTHPEQNVSVPNQQKVYSQMDPATSPQEALIC